MNKQRHDELLEQLLVYRNLRNVSLPTQSADQSLHAITFTISRRSTFPLIRLLYRLTYGNIMHETYPLDQPQN